MDHHWLVGARIFNPPAPLPPSPLLARAEKLWPESPRNQVEWLRAIRVVRASSRGWLLEPKGKA
jgi:hypothetical protein